MTLLPVEVSDLQIAFPADALDYMPKWEDIPKEFRDHYNPWSRLADRIFSGELSEHFSFIPAEGVDAAMAWRQLDAIRRSYQPKHEHKIATIAYLSSLWMESVVFGPRDCSLEELEALGETTAEEWVEYFQEVNDGDDQEVERAVE